VLENMPGKKKSEAFL